LLYFIDMKHNFWRKTFATLFPFAVLFIGGIILSYAFGGIRKGDFEHRIVSLGGVVIFALASIAFLDILTNAISRVIISSRLGVGRASSLKFIMRTFGYLAILITTLDRLGIPVGRILLGSAVLGIILGVAAQQALANFFASIVLIIAHPFTVGQRVTLSSGALGGTYTGVIKDISLTHTHLKQDDNTIVSLPNSTLLIGAAIKIEHKTK
jgi:small-conductance mechanosensitive channel